MGTNYKKNGNLLVWTYLLVFAAQCRWWSIPLATFCICIWHHYCINIVEIVHPLIQILGYSCFYYSSFINFSLTWHVAGWEVLATDASFAIIWVWKRVSRASLWESYPWSKSQGCCYNRLDRGNPSVIHFLCYFLSIVSTFWFGWWIWVVNWFLMALDRELDFIWPVFSKTSTLGLKHWFSSIFFIQYPSKFLAWIEWFLWTGPMFHLGFDVAFWGHKFCCTTTWFEFSVVVK